MTLDKPDYLHEEMLLTPELKKDFNSVKTQLCDEFSKYHFRNTMDHTNAMMEALNKEYAGQKKNDPENAEKEYMAKVEKMQETFNTSKNVIRPANIDALKAMDVFADNYWQVINIEGKVQLNNINFAFEADNDKHAEIFIEAFNKLKDSAIKSIEEQMEKNHLSTYDAAEKVKMAFEKYMNKHQNIEAARMF